MNIRILSALVGFGMLLAAMPAMAHHSFAAEYDSNTLITLTGVITKVEWTNPHSYVHVDTKDAAGKNGELVSGGLPSQHPEANRLSAGCFEGRRYHHDYRL